MDQRVAGASSTKSGSHKTRRWRRQSRANPRFGAPRRVNGSKKAHRISPLGANSLRTRTGNFLRRCREFKLPIREVSGLIRESRFCPLFGPTKPILPRDSAVAEEKRGTPQMLAWPMARYSENHSPGARRTLAMPGLAPGRRGSAASIQRAQPAALPRRFLC